MKLISFQPIGTKFEFTVEYKGEVKSFLLTEREDWPMIFGADLKLVEKWLFKNYRSACFLPFSIFAA